MENRLLLVLFFLLVVISPKAQNLVANGDFENSDGWVVASQMVRGDAAIVDHNPEFPLEDGGNKAMRLHGNSNILTTAKTYFRRDEVTSAVEKQVYTLTFWARGKNAEMDIYLALVGKNDAGANKVDLGNGVFTIPADEVWRKYTKVLDYSSGIVMAGTATNARAETDWDFTQPFTFRIGIAGPQDMRGKDAYVLLDNVSIVPGNTTALNLPDKKSLGKVYSTSSGIVVDGIKGKVSVYTTTGGLVKSIYMDGLSQVLDLPRGVYLVRVNENEVYRVIR